MFATETWEWIFLGMPKEWALGIIVIAGIFGFLGWPSDMLKGDD